MAAGHRRQALVTTVGFEVQSSVLKACERLVDCEHVGDVLRTLRLEGVVAEAANKGRLRCQRRD